MKRGKSPTRLSRGAGLVLGFLFVAFVLAGIIGLATIGNLAWTEWRAGHRYVRTTCIVLDKRVGTSRIQTKGVRDGDVYRPEIRIRYEAGGASHEVWTYDSAQLYSGLKPQAILARYEIGGQYPCWYDPKAPGDAVLVRRSNPLAYLWALLPMLMLVIGGIGVREVSKAVFPPASPPRARRRKPPQAGRGGVVEAPRGTKLPVRLPRTMAWSHQRRLALGLGLFLVCFSGGLGTLLAAHWSEEHLSDRIGMTVVLAGFGLVGLLLLYSALHQMIASLVAETIVEAESRVIGAGESLRVRIIQPGPVHLRSLSAKLVRKEITTLSEGAKGENHEFYDRFVEIGDTHVVRGETLEREAEVRIPRKAQPTGVAGPIETKWLIEVWGRVRFFPGFMHQYEIVVLPHGRRERK